MVQTGMAGNVSLCSGFKMPNFAWGMGTAWFGASGEQAEIMKNSIHLALRNGFYHLDSAQMYRNEASSGQAISEWLNANPSVSRSDLFITSKLGDKNKSSQQVKPSLQKTLSELQTDYLDLFLVHSPFRSDVPLKETWSAMEQLVEDGLVRSIGVSNFRINELKEILSECKIKPSVNQIEYHPFVVNQELVDFCKEQNIKIMAYSGLAPILHFKTPELNEFLRELSEKYSISEGIILQKWLLQQDIGIVTTTSKDNRMKEFFQVFEEPSLSSEEIDKISSIGSKHPHRKYWDQDW